MAFTIGIPFTIGVVTVLLIKSFEEIVLLALLTIAFLGITFGVIGTLILNSRTSRPPRLEP